jgi:hypothetical protein
MGVWYTQNTHTSLVLSHIVMGRTKPKTVMIRVDVIVIATMDIHGQLLLKQIRPCGQISV